MFMQAWGQYGIAWPVIHQQLGVRPALGDRPARVVPQCRRASRASAGDDIRLGDGSVDVRAGARAALHDDRRRVRRRRA